MILNKFLMFPKIKVVFTMYSRLVVNHSGFFIADVDFYRADKSSLCKSKINIILIINQINIILFNETYSRSFYFIF